MFHFQQTGARCVSKATVCLLRNERERGSVWARERTQAHARVEKCSRAHGRSLAVTTARDKSSKADNIIDYIPVMILYTLVLQERADCLHCNVKYSISQDKHLPTERHQAGSDDLKARVFPKNCID